MATSKMELHSTCARHQLTGEDYPIESAHQVELFLDKEQNRLWLFGGLFGCFVLAVVVVIAVAAITH
jgi:hypothetical protein